MDLDYLKGGSTSDEVSVAGKEGPCGWPGSQRIESLWFTYFAVAWACAPLIKSKTALVVKGLSSSCILLAVARVCIPDYKAYNQPMFY